MGASKETTKTDARKEIKGTCKQGNMQGKKESDVVSRCMRASRRELMSWLHGRVNFLAGEKRRAKMAEAFCSIWFFLLSGNFLPHEY